MRLARKYTEDELVNLLCEDYSGYSAVWKEVPNHSQSIDIVCRVNKTIIAIEVKKYDWKRGIEQLKSHKICCDILYLATIHKKLPPDMAEAVNNNGFGLLLFDGSEWRSVIDAPMNYRTFKPERDKLLKNLESIKPYKVEKEEK